MAVIMHPSLTECLICSAYYQDSEQSLQQLGVAVTMILGKHIRVVHSRHFWAIFMCLGQNDLKNEIKNDVKNGYCEHPGKQK